LTLPIAANSLNGAVYDPTTLRLYVEEACVIGDCEPLFQVFVLTTVDAIFADGFE
jgi:hypothetical protein